MSTDFHTLSNSRYATVLSAAGTGYSTWNGLALTRWNGDPVEDNDGFFLYLRDLDSGACWSLGQQPVVTPEARRASRFSERQRPPPAHRIDQLRRGSAECAGR